ncbi:hypothetical protein HK405_012722 [Cladochytrium tenue]|nr:hypothetical protein HK405_012722 [Cladochytrium tenue]
MAFSDAVVVESLVMRERDIGYVNPAHVSKHSDLHHLFVVVHLSDGKAKTVEYGDFDNDGIGTVRVIDGAETIHAMVEAHEFETEGGAGYPWPTFEKWIVNQSGCKRPAHVAHTAQTSKLDLKDPDADAVQVFEAVKNDVVEKLHDLHHKDLVHHTHVLDKLKNVNAYKLVKYGTKTVEYGTIYFGKVYIGARNYVHVRAHKFHDASKPVEFHSIHLTRDSAIWSESSELVYFEY